MLFTYVVYAYLLLAYSKNECRLSIAYIGPQRTKREKRYEYCFFDERKTESTYKKKNLYITYIGKKKKRVKSGQNRHKKRGTKKAPLIPGKRTLTTKAPEAY